MSDLILVDRIDRTKQATRSNVNVGGLPSSYKGLEDFIDPLGPKVYGERAIPAGRYELGSRFSPRFSGEYYTRDNRYLISKGDWLKLSKVERNHYWPHEMIWVKDVPNYEFILIHWGNTRKDTSGCFLIGSEFGTVKGEVAVLASRVAYVKFYAEVMPRIRKGGEFITYRNSFK